MYFPKLWELYNPAGRSLRRGRLVVCGRHAQTRVLAVQSVFEIRSWSAAATAYESSRRGHGGVRHGLYGGQPASSFQNAVTVLLLDIRCSPDHTYRLIVYL